MNHFEFLDMPFSLEIDEARLRKSYFKNSRKYHPDHQGELEPEAAERIMALSTLNTKAYDVLGDFDQRLKYIIKTLDGGEIRKQNLSPEFLMEMMAINEAVSDMMESEKADMKQQILTRDRMAYEGLGDVRTMDLSKATNEDTDRIRAYYFERKYLLRIIENLDNLAPL